MPRKKSPSESRDEAKEHIRKLFEQEKVMHVSEIIRASSEIFGNETEKVLSELKVEFFSARFGYMGVSDEDGHLVVSANSHGSAGEGAVRSHIP